MNGLAPPRIEQLAKQLGATIYTTVPLAQSPYARPWTKELWVHPWTEGNAAQQREAFWATLHELGHVAHPVHRGPDFLAEMFGDPTIAEMEAEAWVWAIDNAGEPLDEIGRNTIAYSISSYFSSFGQPEIGPALQRILDTVGRDLDPALVKEIHPEHAAIALSVWPQAYDLLTQNELAVAA